MDEEELANDMLEMRNTPEENGQSLAEMVYGDEMRSFIPVMTTNKNLAEKRKECYNVGSQNLSTLHIRRKVLIQNEEIKEMGSQRNHCSIG